MFTTPEVTVGAEAAESSADTGSAVCSPSLFRRSLVGGTARSGFSWPLRAIFLCALILWFLPAVLPATAADGFSPSAAVPAGVWWFGGFIGFLSTAVLCLSLWEKVRPDPPLHRQFATADHKHPDYITALHFSNWRRIQKEERERDQRDTREMELRLSSKLDEIGRSLTDELKEVERRLGDRVDPIAQCSSATKQSINQHLEDHRAGRT